MQTTYLLPLTAVSLGVVLAALGFRATRRRGYGPLVAGTLAAGAFFVGKFALDSNVVVYAGLAALIAASLWNSWPRSVPAAPEGTRYEIGSINEEK